MSLVVSATSRFSLTMGKLQLDRMTNNVIIDFMFTHDQIKPANPKASILADAILSLLVADKMLNLS